MVEHSGTPKFVLEWPYGEGSYYYHGLLVLLGHKMPRRINDFQVSQEVSFLLSEMIPHSARNAIGGRDLCASAHGCKQPVAAMYEGILDCFVRTCWARASRAGVTHSVISLEEQVTAG